MSLNVLYFSITKINYPSITRRATELSCTCHHILSPRWLFSEHIGNSYLKVLRHDLWEEKKKKYCTTHEVLTDDFDGIVTADCSKCVRVHVRGHLAIHSHSHWSMMALLVSEGGHRHWSRSVSESGNLIGEMEGQWIHLEKKAFNKWSQEGV